MQSASGLRVSCQPRRHGVKQNSERACDVASGRCTKQPRSRAAAPTRPGDAHRRHKLARSSCTRTAHTPAPHLSWCSLMRDGRIGRGGAGRSGGDPRGGPTPPLVRVHLCSALVPPAIMLRSMMACDMLQHVMGYVGQSSLWIKPPRILWLFCFWLMFFSILCSPLQIPNDTCALEFQVVEARSAECAAVAPRPPAQAPPYAWRCLRARSSCSRAGRATT